MKKKSKKIPKKKFQKKNFSKKKNSKKILKFPTEHFTNLHMKKI